LRKELAQVDLQTWIEEYRVTDKGTPFEFYDRNYLIKPMEDLSPQIVIMKAAQVGATEFAINRTLWFCDTHNVKAIYTFPSDKDVKDFSNSRFTPAIRRSPYLKRRMAETDNVGLKQVGQSFIYFRGSWTERQAISIPSDYNTHDEIDFSNPDIKQLYKERLSASKFRWELNISTPTLPGYSVSNMHENSSQNHWFVKCPHCNREIKWCCGFPDIIADVKEQIYYACPKCRKPVDIRQVKGYWLEKYPNRSVKGYHISQTMCPWISASQLMQRKESHRYVKTFYNFNLGLPYAGSNMPFTRPLIMSCIDNRYSVEPSGRNCTMGVDQGDVLWVVISKTEGDKRRIIHLEKIEGDNAFERVAQLMHRYGVIRCVIDAMPNKNPARKLATEFPGRVYMAYYSEVQKDDVRFDEENYKVLINRTESLDAAAAQVTRHQVILPRLDEMVNLFMEHLCNMAKDRQEDKYGQLKEVWVHIGDDHFCHANNYDEIAARCLPRGSLFIGSKDKDLALEEPERISFRPTFNGLEELHYKLQKRRITLEDMDW